MKDLKSHLVESLLSADFDEEFDKMIEFEEQLKNRDYWAISTSYFNRDKPPYRISGDTLYLNGSVSIHYTVPGFIPPSQAGITKILADDSTIYFDCDWGADEATIDGGSSGYHIKAERVVFRATAIKNVTVNADTIEVSAQALAPVTVMDNVTFNNKHNVKYHNALKTSNFKFNGYPLFELSHLGDEGGYNNTFKNLDNIMQFKRGAKLTHAKKPTRKGAYAVMAVANNWEKYQVSNDEMAELIEFPKDVLQMIGLKASANQLDQFILANYRHKMVFCRDPKRAEYTTDRDLFVRGMERKYVIQLTGPNQGWWVIFFKNNLMKDRQFKL